MSYMGVGVFCILLMVILILLGFNIGMTMFAVGFFGLVYISGWKVALSAFKTIPYTQASNYTLVVIPLFILMGQAAYKAGISGGLFEAGEKWLSRLPGGLAIATIAASAGFSAICGSTVATSATMATVAYPEMRKNNYEPGLSTGCIVAGGTLGVLIPPSTVFIVYGISAEASIGRLFAAGVLPGVFLALLYSITTIIICKIRPDSAPAVHSYPWRERLRSLKGLWQMVLLFLAVIGGMFSGLFTANEAAAMGAVLCLVLMALNRKMSWKNLISSLTESVSTTSMIFQIVLGAYVFNNLLATSMLPTNLARWIISMDFNRYVVIVLIIFIFLILGCLMDSLPLVLLTVPIFLPIVTSLGFDPIWYGVLMVLAADQGVMTPPVGLNVYVVSGMIRDVPMPKIFAGTFPFVIAIFICIVIVIAFPQLALWLPSQIYG